MTTLFKNSIALKRQNSLECTCEIFPLTPGKSHKKYGAKCDFCAEKQFLKAFRSKSLPPTSIYRK